jgi:hypothetical protein
MVAVMKDRVVVGLSDAAVKAGIDAALDKMGGPAPDSQTDKLLKLSGDGSAAFVFDLAALAKLAWPMLMQAVESEYVGDNLPLASLPSTDKMVSLLGPEVAVFKPDAGGILLKSRGKVPFATKLCLFPLAGAMAFMPMVMGGF